MSRFAIVSDPLRALDERGRVVLAGHKVNRGCLSRHAFRSAVNSSMTKKHKLSVLSRSPCGSPLYLKYARALPVSIF